MTEFLQLPAELSIYSVGELHADWMARWIAVRDQLGTDEEIVVGAERVDQVDAAGVQLLLSLRRLVVSHGGLLRLENPSAILVAACVALGASALLAPAPLVEIAS